MGIDQFFTLGPDVPFRANRIFTDREPHIAAFHARVVDHCSRTWPVAQLLDFQRAARNVVVFAGEGGIGKSTLARHTVRLAVERKLGGLPENQACAVVDFADPSSQSFETVMLRIRASLSRLGRLWPAFDLALAMYWERKHPGEPLATFLKKSSRSDSLQMSDQVGATLDALLGGLGVGSLAYRVVELLGHSTAQATRLKRLRSELPAFEPILNEEDPDRMLGYMPVLLAADLERIRERKPTLALCLLDTFEVVQALPAERGGLEDLVARLVYLMPNVLFVAASRRPLRWHDPVRSVGLTYGGRHRWSGLTDDDQWGLDGFDDVTADHYLQTRLTVSDQPVIPPPVRQRIVAGSAGSPLYLELSASLYEQFLVRREHAPAEAFGHPFPELVLRLMRDLSAEDRDLLRAAALLEAFDEQILHAVLPDARGRHIEHFLRHQFIRHDSNVWPPYRLHDSLRRGVNSCDEYTQDGWTTAERRTHVERAIENLTDLTTSIWGQQPTQRLPLWEHSARTVAAFLLALHAAHEHEVLPPGLGQMAYTLSQLGHWQVLASLPEFPDEPELARLTAVARLTASREINVQDRYAAMRQAAGDFDGSVFADYLCFELGSRAHVIGELDAAANYLARIPAGPSPISLGAVFGRADNALRHSDYAEVAALMESISPGNLDRIRMADMLGHAYLHNARFADSVRSFQEALLLSEQANAPLWAARAARHLAQASMWYDPDHTLHLIPRARELSESVGELNGLAQCDMAVAMAHAMTGDWDRALPLLSAARRRFEELGATRELHPVESVEVLLSAASGRMNEAAAQAGRLARAAAGGDPICLPVWVAVATLWTAQENLFEFSSIAWLDSPEAARSRWMEPLDRLRRGARQ